MFREGQMVYAIVTDHPAYPRRVQEDDYSAAAFAERAVAERICAVWNGHYTDSGTPQPWPFYVTECVVEPAGRAAGASPQLDLFEVAQP